MKHTERFTGRVGDYERYRLRYPPKVIEILTDHCGLRCEHLVADIGAGTGMLAELFLENGNSVVAIEPNDDMRAACEQLAKAWPGLTVKKASAENTVLADASVDFVSVGRAWHWFDQERAVTEFQRILRPAGWVVLASNRRSQDGSAEAVEYEKILIKFGRDYRETLQKTRRIAEVAPLFAQGAVVLQEVCREQVQTLEEFLGQTQSFSATPKPGDEGHAGMQVALQEFFARFARDGLLRTGTICSVMACQANGRSGSQS
jgi:ubiquinone/menaquinone biosynthesis C-methylase UbiE